MTEDLSEYWTRKRMIDVYLVKHGWATREGDRVIFDPSAVREEVDTLQSDFKAQQYRHHDETFENAEDSRYADYLLLDTNGDPLAVIEAKRTSKDPIMGQKQASQYADQIKAQTGKDVFIFLSNGYEIWFWNRPREGLRLVKGFHSRDALERIRFQNTQVLPFNTVAIKQEIIDRPYQIEAVKRVLEGIKHNKRKFLLVQATGTGKTRVAMGLIDVLLRSNRVQKVLFLADRKVLRDQAYDEGFKVFFPNEAKSKVYSGALDKNSRLYASTIQTFMECYQEFSPGDFDLIISDEAHRSIYNKWKDVFTYFDCIQVGLTATPSDLIDHDTFRFFDCDGNSPTFLYTFEQAKREGYLVDFKVSSVQTHFQIEGIAPEDIPTQVKKKLVEEGMDEEDLSWEGTDLERKVSVTGTNEQIVREFMENCLTDEGGTLPAKTIIFAVSKKHAKRLWEAFEKLYPEYGGRLAQIVISEDSRALDIKDDFKKQEFPRVAISVDMLDTGVDIPEVCNLVFAKPVFSKIKFWQMIGRGTRSQASCRHMSWLPEGKKDHFLIFDFWRNFEFFQMHPEGRLENPTDAVTTRIFKTRLQQFAILHSANDARSHLLKNKILDDIKLLPQDSISVREHARDVELALSPTLWDNVGVDPIQFLNTRMTPLVRFQQDVNLFSASFTLKIEKLSHAILTNNRTEIEHLSTEIGEWLNCLPRTLQQVKQKEELLDKVLSKSFWTNITFEDAQMLLKEFAPLMPYKRSEPRPMIILDMNDVVQQRTLIEFGPDAQQAYADEYRAKVEEHIKALADGNPAIQKIREDRVLNEEDLKVLETTLNSPGLYITEEVLQQAYAQHKGTLVQFIKKVLGMYEFPDPTSRVAEEFKTFMIEHNGVLTADQVNFLRTLQTVLLQKKHVEYKDFFDPPFSNIPHAPAPLFSEDILRELVELCQRLEQEL